ncbi:hypothetical protein CLV59_108290 [Chitinophaga dinghuensis]|uniref:Uncharacterized protein n=1 Tax=Chitinophaga dinghuensis TaxID=1539050 RepID=A0A327VRR8_9BACT|nr:hypothetical protein [Chitinophaga dinghuensis]RAJ76769.1 hypothetical protein CLV59_108290 [Chitinophaga dinghuensis]
MLSKLLMVVMLAVTTYGMDVNTNKSQPAAAPLTKEKAKTYTSYPSTWKGVPVLPADQQFMFSSYMLNRSTGVATLMINNPQYSILAGSADCRFYWLNSNIDPNCTGTGCRTWSYYYMPDGTFTSNNIYLIVYCPY